MRGNNKYAYLRIIKKHNLHWIDTGGIENTRSTRIHDIVTLLKYCWFIHLIGMSSFILIYFWACSLRRTWKCYAVAACNPREIRRCRTCKSVITVVRQIARCQVIIRAYTSKPSRGSWRDGNYTNVRRTRPNILRTNVALVPSHKRDLFWHWIIIVAIYWYLTFLLLIKFQIFSLILF